MLFLITIVFCIAGSLAQFDPYSVGPYNVERIDISHNDTADLSQNLNIWYPTTEGSYPFFLLLDSFGALTPGDAYNDVMERVTTYGYVVVNAWALRAPIIQSEKVPMVEESIAWCKANLEPLIQESNAGLTVDYDMSFGMGHSAGSHVLCELLEESCGDFKAIVWSSPVDGNDPAGTLPFFCTRNGRTLSFITPVLVLPAGLDSALAPGAAFACASEDISNRRFYDAMDDSSPKWLINATDFGHADYLDEEYYQLNIERSVCAYNDAGGDVIAGYRNFVSGTIVSFLKAVVEDDCSEYLPYLEDPSVMSVDTSVDNNRTDCPTPFCTNT